MDEGLSDFIPFKRQLIIQRMNQMSESGVLSEKQIDEEQEEYQGNLESKNVMDVLEMEMMRRLKNCNTIIKTVSESFKPLTKEQAIEVTMELDPSLNFFKAEQLVE